MRSSSKEPRGAKRYVLLLAEGDLTESERRQLAEVLAKGYGQSKLIPVQGNPRAVIVKTTNETAPRLRNLPPGFAIQGKRLTPALTSGAIGKLKRRAALAAANGKVHER
jgi:hypothetical protein